MAKIHDVLALAATALAFTTSVPHSARAQSGPFFEFWGESQEGGTLDKNAERLADFEARQRAGRRQSADESRRARLQAYQRELDDLHGRIWFEQSFSNPLLQRWQQRMMRSVARQAQEEAQNARNMGSALQGNGKVSWKCAGPNQAAMLWQRSPSLADAQQAMKDCNDSSGGGGSASTAGGGGTK